MKKLLFIGLLTAILGFSTLADAKLVYNGFAYNGGRLIYDTDRDITWYDAPVVARHWSESMAWATNLSMTVNGKIYNNWRLPASTNLNPDGTITDPTYGYNVTGSEMGHLYYTEFNSKGYAAPDGSAPQPDYGLGDKSPFINLQAAGYWSTEYAPGSSDAWAFYFMNGNQTTDNKDLMDFYSLAVHDGNVRAPVPIPGAVYLLGSDLIGFVGLRRRFKK